MFERIEDLLTVIVSLLVALTSLVSVLEKLLMLWAEMQDESSEFAKQLEKDILHLQADLEQQAEQLDSLKKQVKTD